MRAIALRVVSSCIVLLAVCAPVAAQAPAPPVVKEGTTVKVSEHVWVIPDEEAPMVPNVGIVAGSRGTLIWDPGMGTRSGQVVLREAQKLSRGPELWIAEVVKGEFAARYKDWAQPARIGPAAAVFYREE